VSGPRGYPGGDRPVGDLPTPPPGPAPGARYTGDVDDPRPALDACQDDASCRSTAHLSTCPAAQWLRHKETGVVGLTPLEHSVIARLGECWGDICAIVGDGPARDDDLREMRDHVHALQRALGSQAAARAHPGHFRLLGETL
jgi:hypothetical protein